jgi:hypothetical protein
MAFNLLLILNTGVKAACRLCIHIYTYVDQYIYVYIYIDIYIYINTYIYMHMSIKTCTNRFSSQSAGNIMRGIYVYIYIYI